MRTRSLVPRPNTTFIGLGTILSAQGNRNEQRARLARSLPVVVGKVCEHYTGKALNSAANLLTTLYKVATHSCSKLWCYDGQLSI